LIVQRSPFARLNCGKEIFVELKGSGVYHAVDQLETTVNTLSAVALIMECRSSATSLLIHRQFGYRRARLDSFQATSFKLFYRLKAVEFGMERLAAALQHRCSVVGHYCITGCNPSAVLPQLLV
jgi:hypothetical protein